MSSASFRPRHLFPIFTLLSHLLPHHTVVVATPVAEALVDAFSYRPICWGELPTDQTLWPDTGYRQWLDYTSSAEFCRGSALSFLQYPSGVQRYPSVPSLKCRCPGAPPDLLTPRCTLPRGWDASTELLTFCQTHCSCAPRPEPLQLHAGSIDADDDNERVQELDGVIWGDANPTQNDDGADWEPFAGTNGAGAAVAQAYGTGSTISSAASIARERAELRAWLEGPVYVNNIVSGRCTSRPCHSNSDCMSVSTSNFGAGGASGSSGGNGGNNNGAGCGDMACQAVPIIPGRNRRRPITAAQLRDALRGALQWAATGRCMQNNLKGGPKGPFGKRDGLVEEQGTLFDACTCNSTYVSAACCGARDGLVYEAPELWMGGLGSLIK
ncbi:MAG: hypothetical protein M1824_000980 [Vezdaea acicularis]|nr:MAG: hypothetical protein M1824_000980 [Vezdaea acicularis]